MTALTLVAIASVLLAGCGSTTKTVTVSGAPLPAKTAGGSTTGPGHAAGTPAPRPSSTTTPTNSNQSSSGANGTRVAPAPAFTTHGTDSGEAASTEAAAAVGVVKAHGYTPASISEYHPHQTLRVLLGTRAGSADGYDQRAFFFVDGRYIGTDASQPSASIRVVDQNDTEVTLAYPLYRPHDPLCCPGGGEATVHFQLNNGKLDPLDPIPPFSSQTGTSRN